MLKCLKAIGRFNNFLYYGKKEFKTGGIKLPMSLCCKCGGKVLNKPFENH
jgi:hypothetical protein